MFHPLMIAEFMDEIKDKSKPQAWSGEQKQWIERLYGMRELLLKKDKTTIADLWYRLLADRLSQRMMPGKDRPYIDEQEVTAQGWLWKK